MKEGIYMYRLIFSLSGIALALSLQACVAGETTPLRRILDTELDDYTDFYSARNMIYLGGGLAVGALLANTPADMHIRNWYQEDVRSESTDHFAKSAKYFGEGAVACPVFAGAWLIGLIGEDDGMTGVIGEWGSRSLRSVIVGGPPLLAFQRILGNGRPTEGSDSKWVPFKNDNGASGHAFIGEIPFLSAAEMVDNRAVKSLLYAGSSLAGFSRINDDMHYTSQVLLGWWIAYLAETSVDRSETKRRRFEAVPVVIGGNPGVALTFAF
jgi:hypothetical protein